MEIFLGQKVKHKNIYSGYEILEVVGIKINEVLLKGDYSGGTHNTEQESWMPLSGLLIKNAIGEWIDYNTEESIFKMAQRDEFIANHTMLPKKLTAENGAKGLLIGEFYETIQIKNTDHCDCGECQYCEEFPESKETIEYKIPVNWDTIKKIYNKIVSEFTRNTNN